MKLQAALELGLAAGMTTLQEAIANVDIHAMNIFAYDEIKDELTELFSEVEALGLDPANTMIDHVLAVIKPSNLDDSAYIIIGEGKMTKSDIADYADIIYPTTQDSMYNLQNLDPSKCDLEMLKLKFSEGTAHVIEVKNGYDAIIVNEECEYDGTTTHLFTGKDLKHLVFSSVHTEAYNGMILNELTSRDQLPDYLEASLQPEEALRKVVFYNDKNKESL